SASAQSRPHLVYVCSAASPCYRSPFFLHSHGPPRPLHSFPTRRSSDLVDLFSGVDILVTDCLRREPHPTHASLATAIEMHERCKDRKSIRLNSSHVKISYAVFCLKKKKKNKKGHTQIRIVMTAQNARIT